MNIQPLFAAISVPVIIAVIVIVFLLFGANKLPELARGLGKARRELKKATEEVEDDLRKTIEDEERENARKKIIEEEERVKIRARIEEEERAKLKAERKSLPKDFEVVDEQK